MVGENWEDYFDVIIVQARKPLFFTDESRPLRIYDKDNDTYLWDRVTELKKGTIYFEVKYILSCLHMSYYGQFSYILQKTKILTRLKSQWHITLHQYSLYSVYSFQANLYILNLSEIPTDSTQYFQSYTQYT